MNEILHGIRMAFRQTCRRPSFSLMVTGMLAVGIAGNATIFSIFDGLFLHPLPFEDSARLVELDETAPKWNLKYVGVSNPDSYEWEQANSTFDSMAYFTPASSNLADGERAERVNGVQVTHDMLRVLRLEPLIGRNFQADEDKPGGAHVVLLTYGLWQRLFQGDRHVLGRVVKLDEQPYTIIGVLPRAAVFPDRADLWTPLAADPSRPSGYYLNGVGRLKPGVSPKQAEADLLRIHRGMISSGRTVNAITSPVVLPLRDRYLGDLKTISRVLLVAVLIVLLVVSVNIAALMMVRGSSRAREIAIRNAIGASRGRIAAQLLMETLVLTFAGAALGIPLGMVCLQAAVSRMPSQIPRWITFPLDWRFAVFCAMVTGAAALLSGLAPIFQASGIDVREALQNAASRTTATRGRRTALGAFIVCEVALAVMLAISAGLIVQAFRDVVHVNPGFRPESVLTFGISLPYSSYDRPEQKISYYENLLERLRQLPGVKAAGLTSAPPLGGHWGGQFEAEGGHINRQGESPVVLRIAATPGYFDAIGSTLLAGRTFAARDCRLDSPLVVAVNESFARHFWPGESPIGKRIRYPGRTEWYEVIGLLRDQRQDGLDQEPPPSVFPPYSTALFRAATDDLRSLRLMTFMVRGAANLTTLAAPIREIVRQLDPDVPMYSVQTMTSRLEQSLWPRRAYSWLFGAFALIAVSLATAGVYGIVSYSVSQRTQEIGIRVALGARPAQVLRHVLAGGMALVGIGAGAGLFGTIWSTALLDSLLFDVSPRDPAIYLAVISGIVLVGLLATFFPARRAAAVDPIRALNAK